MISKGYRRFKDRLRYFKQDIEFTEIVVLNKEMLKGDNAIFQRVSHDKFPILSKRENTPESRKLVVEHLRKTVYTSFIKDLYEEVTEYLKYILKEAALNGAKPERLVGAHRVQMSANDILLKRDKQEIVEAIMLQIFQQLEGERSTIELIKKIKNKLGINLQDKLVDDAVPYLEIRHILVHSDGKPTEEFKNKYPTIKLDKKRKISLNYKFAQSAYNSIDLLLKQIDSEMMNLNYLSNSEIVN